jgi:hypothetical protein
MIDKIKNKLNLSQEASGFKQKKNGVGLSLSDADKLTP